MAQRLVVDRLSLAATTPLVNQVSLTVRRGHTLALVGGSGSGKSLTCLAMLDTLPPGVRRTGGTLSVDGQVHPPAILRGRLVATIMQNPRSAFNPLHTVAHHFQETARALGISATSDRFKNLLAGTGLDGSRVLKLYPFEMSGGMLQRVMIAIAILSEAPFIVADEPTADLDTLAQANLLDLLEQVVAQRAPGLLLVTHDMGIVARLADEVAVMEAGEIVENDCVEPIFYRPRHPATRQLINGHLALYGMALMR